ncbi:MAG: hypothetical protein ABWZ40_10295 [Caulobacterales bacterium]
MTLTKLITFTALIYLNGCSAMQSGPQANFAPVNAGPSKSAPLPNTVSADQFTWDVAPGAAPQTLRLTQKIQVASAGAETPPQTPPTDEQVKKAAEQALPPSCKIEEVKTSNGESQVKFSC